MSKTTPLFYEAAKFLDSRFEEALQRVDWDFPPVAFQAAQMLHIEELRALADLPRKDGSVNQGSRNLLDLARHALLVATFAWDTGIVKPGLPWASAMEMAVEMTALCIRSLVFVGDQTDEELKRAIGYQVLADYTWRISPSRRYTFALAVGAMAHIPSDTLFRFSREERNSRFLHLMISASLGQEQGPWNSLKAADLRETAEVLFLEREEPDPHTQQEARKERQWAERLQAKISVTTPQIAPDQSAFGQPLL